MSFYVCLPSNVCANEFPDNTQSNYTTILKKPIQLDSDYEVAMTEITYSPKFFGNYGTLEFNNYQLEYPTFVSKN